MRPLLSTAQVRSWEDGLMQSGVPGALLMENAGRGAAHIIGLRGKPRIEAKVKPTMLRGSCVRCADEQALANFRVFVLVGPGNNGGDGYVVARHLYARAAQVTCVTLGAWSAEQQAITSDAAQARRAFQAIGGQVQSVDSLAEFQELWLHWSSSQKGDTLVPPVVVDALFGSGLTRPLAGIYRQVVEQINQWSGSIIALDLPSGLCADSGSTLGGVAVCAEQTITFGHLKQGLLTTSGLEQGGRVTLSHIGVPASLNLSELAVQHFLLEASDLSHFLHPRASTIHKGRLPRIAVWGGVPQYAGAARLSGLGALRAGAGLTTIVSGAESALTYQNEALELMTKELDIEINLSAELKSFDALVLGPGLGRTAASQAIYERVVVAALAASVPPESSAPLLVLDADALYFLAESPQSFKLGSVVLTPHPKEAAHLLGLTTQAVEADRYAAVRALAQQFSAVSLLKGPRTLISDGETVWALGWGSPALATPGSGDVLSGVIASLWAEGTMRHDEGRSSLRSAEGLNSPESALEEPMSAARQALQATALAAGLHAMAGERWAEAHADSGLLASELALEVADLKGQLLL